MVRTVLVGFVIVALLGPVHATAGQAADSTLPGVYSCEGTNPDGATYSGIVEIIKHNDTYLVRWTMPNDSQVVGVGILNGNLLAVSYYGGTPALVVYSVVENGRLEGKWTAGGAEGALFKETLTRMPEGARQPPSKRPARPRSRITV